MKTLDLFCGLGGWSDGLAEEGFDVLGVEIEPMVAKLYKHPVICEDVRNLNPRDFTGYDLIVGSPPCRDFSQTTTFGKYYWKDPPDPEGRGMELVNAFLRFIEEAEPRYWCLENVPGLKKYLDMKPRIETHLGRTMKRCIWGNFPAFFIIRDMKTVRIKADIQGPLRKWKRAIIPLSIAKGLGRAVKSALEPIQTPPMSIFKNKKDSI